MKKSFLFLTLSALVLAGCGGGNSSSSSSAASSSAASSSGASSQESSQTSGASESTSIPVSSSQKSDESSSQGSSESSSEDSSASSSEELPEGAYHGKLRIWYHRDDMNYTNMAIYLWNAAVDGKEYAWTGEDEEYGVFFETDLSTNEQFAAYPSTDIRLIIKYAGSWSGQSLDTFCKFEDFEVDDDGYMNIYTAAGEGTAIDTFKKRNDALGDHFDLAYFEDWRTIVVTGTGTKGSREESEVGLIASYELYAFTREYYRLREAQKVQREAEFRIAVGSFDEGEYTKSIQFDLPDNVDLTTQYEVRGVFVSDTTKTKKKAVNVRKLFDTEEFQQDYIYDGDDLGVTVNANGTKTFKVWAPTSGRVRVCGYLFGTPWNLAGRKVVDSASRNDMDYVGNGVWELTWNKSYVWYTYEAENSNGKVEAADPYSKATGLNGERSAIVNWDDASVVDPEGWNDGQAVNDSLPTITSANNLTVYEAHVRDLTADSTWISNEGNRRGTYNAFCEEGTTYNGVKTGFDHIKELGVNAIQLLPVFDSDNDERIDSTYSSLEDGGVLDGASYNWGYNPLNYNAVDGAYSTDPESATASIREYKNLILTAAKNGIRIIMDVVYNHMASVANNCFSKLVPFYFFRTDANGFYTDGSGCGNEFASERPMASKFIADSVKWWVSEYQVKGFRFDLMGVLDLETMKAVRAAVNSVDPTIVLYGEGWVGGGSALEEGRRSMTNNVYGGLNMDANFPVGCFNDAGRDGSKGNTTWANVTPAGGWINEGSNVDNVYNALTQILGENRWAKQACGGDNFDMNPNQTLNYLACHDNYTLYDQINYLFYKDQGTFGDINHEPVMQAATALSALSLMGQGIGFIHGGDEFFRSKIIASDDPWFEEFVATYRYATNGTDSWIEGDGIRIDDDHWLVRNSYKYGDAVNSFKWDRLLDQTVSYGYDRFCEMVALRNAEMGNTLGQNIGQIKAGGTTCWGVNDLFDDDGEGHKTSKTDLLAGAFKGQADEKFVYIFVNKGNGNASISLGNQTLDVLFSATSDRQAGDEIAITNNSITLPKFGALIVRAR